MSDKKEITVLDLVEALSASRCGWLLDSIAEAYPDDYAFADMVSHVRLQEQLEELKKTIDAADRLRAKRAAQNTQKGE